MRPDPQPEHGKELAPGFEQLGWETERNLYMVLRRGPDHPAETVVEGLCFDSIAALRQALLLEDDDVSGPEVAQQLLERDRRVGDVRRDRWFAARYEGELASCCRLIQGERFGQIEDVATLEAARGNGLARAVVLAAAQASIADADPVTFIVADADDWPLELYKRLGFDPIGICREFRVKPPSGG